MCCRFRFSIVKIEYDVCQKDVFFSISKTKSFSNNCVYDFCKKKVRSDDLLFSIYSRMFNVP